MSRINLKLTRERLLDALPLLVSLIGLIGALIVFAR